MTTDDRTTLAGELALGLLDGDERAAALRLVLADPAFARDVDRWRRHFETLFADWSETEPGADIERRVMAATAAPRGPRRWIAATALFGAIAASLLVALILRPERIVIQPAPPPPAAAPPLVAAIAPTGGKPFAALYDDVRGEVRLAGRPDVPAGRSAELWTIGGDGVPHAMGLLAESGRVVVAPAVRTRVTAGTTLAISIEPKGGSPTGLPTGPVVATGVLAAA